LKCLSFSFWLIGNLLIAHAFSTSGRWDVIAEVEVGDIPFFLIHKIGLKEKSYTLVHLCVEPLSIVRAIVENLHRLRQLKRSPREKRQPKASKGFLFS